MKNIDWVTAAITTIATSFITLIGTAMIAYYVQYSLIEKPKIEVENRRSRIESYKIIEAIIPMPIISCITVPYNERMAWRLECAVTNKGEHKFAAKIKNEDVLLYDTNVLELNEYRPNALTGFFIDDLTSSPSSTVVSPGKTNVIYKSIALDRSRYPGGISHKISVKPCIEFNALDSLERELKNIFPESAELVDENKFVSTCSRAPLQQF